MLVLCSNLSHAQRTTTLYGAPQSQRSSNWWSTRASGATSLPTKIPAAGRAVSKTPHPAVARIIVPERKSAALGSGTLIARTAQHGYLLTNWHVVREAKSGALVVFANGTQAQGKILRTDKDWDLALLQIPAPAIEPLSISATVPQVGEQLWIAGYGSGEFLLQAGLCSQYLAPYPEWPLELVEVGAAARQGDSGGPILNANGELAGVLFGQGEGYTMGAYGGRVLQFLNQCPDIDSPVRGTIAQLAATRVSGTAEANNLTGTSLPFNRSTQFGTTLVSNSADRFVESKNPEQRYWVPERRQPVPSREFMPLPPAANPALIANAASPASNDSMAMNTSNSKLPTTPLGMYSLPKSPPTAPAVASQYKSSPGSTSQNAFGTNPSGYGLRPEPYPTASVSISTPAAEGEHLTFEDFAGHSLADQAITGLWCLAGIYLLFKICGWLTRAGSATHVKKTTIKRAVIRKPTLKTVAPRAQKNDLYSYNDEEEDEDDEEDDDEDDDDE